MRTTLTAIAASALLVGSAFAASHGGALDADGDGMLTEEEFGPIASMGASFAAYDSDGDGMLSQEEYNEGLRELVDEDGDGSSLSPEEMQKLDEMTKMFAGDA